MKQVLRKGFKDIVVDEVPAPRAAPHHLVVRPSYSLISSGTETADIHKDGVLREVAQNPSHIARVLDVMRANGPVSTTREVLAKFRDLAVLGYSGAGVVSEVHPSITDLSVGDRVAYGGEGTGHGEFISTGRLLVAPVPDNVSLDEASFATLGSIAMNTARASEATLGDRVVVLGLGLVGQLVTQLLQLQGARVIGVDLRPHRVELARQLGAEDGFIAGDSLDDAIRSATGDLGADVVVIAAASKSPEVSRQAVRLCRDRGRIVVVGAVEMSFPWSEMYLKELKVVMARAYGPGSYDSEYERKARDYPLAYVRWTENRNMTEFLRLLSEGKVNVSRLISHRFPLSDAALAYDTIFDQASQSLAVVLEYPRREEALTAPSSEDRVVVNTTASRPRSGQIGVALVGASNIARWAHIPALRSSKRANLRAVYSGHGARAKSYAERFKAAYSTTEYERILDDDAIGAVIITSRNQNHAREAIAALNAGKHVLVEKPLALSLEECRQVMAAQEASGCVLAVGFNRRFSPYYVAAKRALAKRGTPAVINMRVSSPGISGNFWMADPAIGGAILGEAVHFVDLLAWLTDSEIDSVSAFSLPTGMKHPIGENNVAATFRMADGSVANLTYCTTGSARSSGEEVEAFAGGIGVVTRDFKELVVSGAVKRRSRKFVAAKGYNEQFEAFINAIHGQSSDLALGVDGVRATLGCLGLMQSARLGGAPQAISLSDAIRPVNEADSCE